MTVIRPAIPVDLPQAMELIRELAAFERAPEAVKVTDAQFEQFFLEQRFDLLVAHEDNRLLGLALFYEAYSTWKGKFLYLEDLIVTEKRRGEGIGKQLLEAVIAEAKHRQMAFVKWQVLDWNTGAIRFYERYGITKDDQWMDCKLWLAEE